MLLAGVLFLASVLRGQTLSNRTYGGSGNDAINGIATDPSGNIYAVGTTTSFDLPLLHPSQPANTGTQLVYSADAGLTWKPLLNLPIPPTSPFAQTVTIAVDPTNPSVVYAGAAGLVFKSIDAGQHFSAGATLPGAGSQAYVSSLAIDPTQPSLVYATAVDGGTVYKSTDAGNTWTQVSGLPATGDYDSVVLDPFHPKSLWVWAGSLGYISTDGGDTWNVLPLPFQGSISGGIRFVFDAATPGTVYGPANGVGSGIQKSTDGGQTWTPVAAPFNAFTLVADPVRAGYLYAVDSVQSPQAFYRSQNGGATWQSFPFPNGPAGIPAIDPANPNIIVAGTYRSTDDGQTWSPVGVSRNAQTVFAPNGKGLGYASAAISSDIFLAKFAPDGQTLLFATYFGGMGSETASAIQIDGSGNVWVAGTTGSFDLPVSGNAPQAHLNGPTNGFLAKFSSEGQFLAATYLGGSSYDTMKSLKLDAGGNVWMVGETASPNFPITTGTAPPLHAESANEFVYLAKTDPLVSKLLYSAFVTSQGSEQPGGLSIDPSGNIVITGTTYSSSFPISGNVIHASPSSGSTAPYAFLMKFDGSGNTIFSTYLGGSKPGDSNYTSYVENEAVAVATDASGIYLTGNTSAVDFPTTPGAYQTTIRAGCTYPAFADDTGFIGTIFSYFVDDVFVTKLSPDGSTLIYSTLLGGSCYDRPTDMLISAAGAVYVTGETNSIDFPVMYPVENAPSIEQYKSFVSVFNASGSALPFSTYLFAGSGPVLALGGDGVVHVGGSTGYLAQTQTQSGFLYAPPVPATDGYLVALSLPATPPALDLAQALNAFSLLSGPIAAGEIVSLSVSGLRPTQSINEGFNDRQPLPTSLGGAQVLFDGKPVSLVDVAPGRIVCIAPQDFGTAQTTAIQVNLQGATSNPLTVPVAANALGLLSADGTGQGAANARNADGTLNSATNPAKRGSTVTVYFTGGGVPLAPVTINFSTTTVSSLNGFVPGIDAAYFQVPADAPTGYPFSVSIESNSSQSQTLTVYIQ